MALSSDDEEEVLEALSASSSSASYTNTGSNVPTTRASSDIDYNELLDSDEETTRDRLRLEPIDDGPTRWADVDSQEIAIEVASILQAYKIVKDESGEDARLLREKSLRDVQAQPQEMEDPLGFGMIDSRSKALIKEEPNTETVESVSTVTVATKKKLWQRKAKQKVVNKRVVERTQTRRQAVRGDQGAVVAADDESILPLSENFDPHKYLAKVHKDSTAMVLISGQAYLRETMAEKSKQLRMLVKDNLERFLSSHNTIEDVTKRMRQNLTEQDGTVAFSTSIAEVQAECRSTFKSLIERQVAADRIRSVLGLLQRFQALFNLPTSIREDIASGKYEKVVREYKKAQTLIQAQETGVLHALRVEVEQIMAEFQGMLYASLESPTLDQLDAERAVRLLIDIEPESDAAWHYLRAQHKRIEGLFDNCERLREDRLAVVSEQLKNREQSESRWKELNRTEGSMVNLSLLLGDSDGAAANGEQDGVVEEAAEVEAEFIAQLSRALAVALPEFWRLAQSIFNGKFTKVSESASATDEEGSSTQSTPRVGRAGTVAPGAPRLIAGHTEVAKRAKLSAPNGQELSLVMLVEAEVENIVVELVQAYQQKLDKGLASLRQSRSISLRWQLRECVQRVLETRVALQSVAQFPSRALSAVASLCSGAMEAFIHHLNTRLREAGLRLHKEEDWQVAPVAFGRRRKTPFRISDLPLKLSDLLTSVVDDLTRVLGLEVGAQQSKPLTLQQAGKPSSGGAVGFIRPVTPAEAQAMAAAVRPAFFEAFKLVAVGLRRLSLELAACARSQQSSSLRLSIPSRDGELARDRSGVSLGGFGATRSGGGRSVSGSGSFGGGGGGGAVGGGGRLLSDPLTAPAVARTAEGDIVHAIDSRFLMVVSNCAHCRGVLLPDCISKFQQLMALAGAPTSMADPIEAVEAVQILDGLQEELLSSYISRKASAIGPAVEKYLTGDGTVWGAARPPVGVRGAMLHLLQPLLQVHSEAYVGAELFVERMVKTMLTALLRRLHEGMAEKVPSLSHNGYCQLVLEVNYLDVVLAAYATEEGNALYAAIRQLLFERAAASAPRSRPSRSKGGSSAASAEAEKYIARLHTDSKRVSEQLLPHELRRTRIIVLCFAEDVRLRRQRSSQAVPMKEGLIPIAYDGADDSLSAGAENPGLGADPYAGLDSIKSSRSGNAGGLRISGSAEGPLRRALFASPGD